MRRKALILMTAPYAQAGLIGINMACSLFVLAESPLPMPFVELSALSNFTFLTGASHPEEMMERAAELGMPALAVADVNSVAGIVRAHTRARELARDGGPRTRLIPSARIILADGFQVTCLPRDRAAWGRLCRMLSAGQLRAPKGECELHLADLLDWGAGLEMLVLPRTQRPTLAEAGPAPMGDAARWREHVGRLAQAFPGQVSLAMAPRYDGQDGARFQGLAALASALGVPPVATALPFLHHGQRRRLADVPTALRLGLTVDELGRRALPNNEGRLRSEAEMLRMFKGHEAAVARAGEVAARAAFSLDELRYEYPSENAPGETASQRLARLAEAGLRWRYPEGPPAKARAQMAHELDLIARLAYEPYFLTVHDIVAFARSRGILCQGRGSAANSVVCYALGVTSVSPEIGTMVFERFISEARNEPPDIDVDFEHERREEVIQHIYARYGRHRAGLCATVIHYRGKRAVREVGRTVLERLNYQVLLATDGADGLVRAAEHRHALRAVITDLHMPHMDGLAFVRALRRTLPNVPVVVASGRVDEAVASELLRLGVTRRLDKPFTQAQLARELRAVFSAG